MADSNSIFNGHQYVNFGYTDGYATSSAFFTGANPRSVAAVYDNPTGANGVVNPIAGEAGANSGGDCFVLQARQSGPNGDPYLAGFANDLSSGTVPAANQLTFTVATYDGTTATLYWAYGVIGAVHSVSAAYSFTTTGSNFDIGYDFEEPSQNDMQIGQVLVYENSLNATAATDEIESLQSEYAAPEPTTWALIMSGGGPVFLVARRRFIA